MRKQSEWLKGLRIEKPQVAEDAFAVFPLTTENYNARGYLTLDEAVQRGLVSISESGSVREIIVVVDGETPVLVVEGTVVVGGKQNRTVNISLLLDAGGKEHIIPVSCVEAGRWSFRRPSRYYEPTTSRRGRIEREEREEVYEPRMFMLSEFTAHANLRRKKTASAVRSYMVTNALFADQNTQNTVWREVERMHRDTGVQSPTEDEMAFYERYLPTIEDLLRPIKPLENQVGAVIAIGQEIMGLEVFDHPETWKVTHRRILSGYAADALKEILRFGKPRALVNITGAKEFLDTVASSLDRARIQPSPVGLGEHYLFDEKTTSVGGFALVHEGLIIHLFAFPASSIRW